MSYARDFYLQGVASSAEAGPLSLHRDCLICARECDWVTFLYMPGDVTVVYVPETSTCRGLLLVPRQVLSLSVYLSLQLSLALSLSHTHFSL